MYSKTDWKNNEVEYPKRYTLTDNGDGTYTIQKSPGEIRQAGTPLSAGQMNNIESGVDAASLLSALLYSMFAASAEGADQATQEAEGAAEAANAAAKFANEQALAASEQAGAAHTAAETALTQAGEAHTAAEAANQAANLANEQASIANTAANLANEQASAANTAANTANAVGARFQNMVVTSGVREYGSGNTASLTDDGTKKILSLGIERGAPGAQGQQGIQGEKGEKGDKGDKGDTGPAGVTFSLQGTVLYITLG